MEGIEISRDGTNYIITMSADAFASFAYWLLGQPKEGKTNGESKLNKGGRPRKEQPALQEGA